jgi:hypothetical protein
MKLSAQALATAIDKLSRRASFKGRITIEHGEKIVDLDGRSFVPLSVVDNGEIVVWSANASALTIAGVLAQQIEYSKAWDESEHPRDDQGRFTESGGGGGDGGVAVSAGEGKPIAGWSAGVKASRDNIAIEKVKNDWFEESPFRSVGEGIDGAIAAARPAQEQLGNVGAEISKNLGVEFKNPGVKKDAERIKEKVVLRGGPERVTDLARASFVVDKPEHVETIAVELAKHFEVAREDWKVTPVNYADAALQIRFANGLIGEVQILERKMSEAKSPDKGKGHDLYVEQRKLDPVKDKERFDALTEKMRAHYGKVLDDYSPEWKAALGIGGKRG